MIQRIIEKEVLSQLINHRKIIVIYGARQVGKTTMVQSILRQSNLKVLSINAEDQSFGTILTQNNVATLRSFTAGYDVLFIDEAQSVSSIGKTLKLIYDHIPELKVIVTGSSFLGLAERIKEPLTGRVWTFQLYPISYAEEKIYFKVNDFEMNQRLSSSLLYGSYPELYDIENETRKRKFLAEISSSYLYKDILMLAGIKYAHKLRQLLKLLAYQIGNLVSIQELANALQINRDTVINYIDLLEKSFVLVRLTGFSKNLRKEITKMDKIYFVDLGIRNAILENFDDLQFRNDRGAMWENYLIIERMKRNDYKQYNANNYFWRLYSGAELDYIEERDGKLNGYEIKWKPKKQSRSTTWIETYDKATKNVINTENYHHFLNHDTILPI